MMLATIGLDFIWIAKLMNRFYLEAFSSFGRISEGKFAPILWAAGIVYLILPAVVLIFVVIPSIDEPYLGTLAKGAFLGLCLYGLYDFTNLATIQDWSVKVTLVDIVWGTFLCAVISVIGKWLVLRT